MGTTCMEKKRAESDGLSCRYLHFEMHITVYLPSSCISGISDDFQRILEKKKLFGKTRRLHQR